MWKQLLKAFLSVQLKSSPYRSSRACLLSPPPIVEMGVVSSCLKLIMATGAELHETALKVSREETGK